MKTFIKPPLFAIVICIAATFFSSCANKHAAVHPPQIKTDTIPPLNPLYIEFKSRHDFERATIMNDPTLSRAEKNKQYKKLWDELKASFTVVRTKQLESVSVLKTKKGTINKDYAGPPKIKHTIKVYAPDSNYFTKKEWTSRHKTDGTPLNRKAKVSRDGRKAWKTIERSGRGKYGEQVRATFKLKPEYISRRTASDLEITFKRILEQ